MKIKKYTLAVASSLLLLSQLATAESWEFKHNRDLSSTSWLVDNVSAQPDHSSYNNSDYTDNNFCYSSNWSGGKRHISVVRDHSAIWDSTDGNQVTSYPIKAFVYAGEASTDTLIGVYNGIATESHQANTFKFSRALPGENATESYSLSDTDDNKIYLNHQLGSSLDSATEVEATQCFDEPEFHACETPRPEFCGEIYAPVCATVKIDVQCVLAPCPEILEVSTRSNACSACADSNVIGYTDGACEAEILNDSVQSLPYGLDASSKKFFQ